MMQSPVLLIVFRRPEVTARVFAAIAAARPPRLFIAGDAPADPRDAGACNEVRRIVANVDWPCQVRTDFSTSNLGCDARVSSALEWFFDECESGIVLEDDCLADPDFFRFCDAMLERYRDDERIVHVSGETYRRARGSPDSYYFSKYALTWGWATWRRAWRLFDFRMQTWPDFRRASPSLALYDSADERDYWNATFQQMHDSQAPNWDYPWMYACLSNGLSIHPAVNLVQNIGGGAGATHTFGGDPGLNRRIGSLETQLRHPAWVVRDRQADMDTFDDRYVGAILKKQRTFRHHAGRPGRWLRRTLRRRPPPWVVVKFANAFKKNTR